MVKASLTLSVALLLGNALILPVAEAQSVPQRCATCRFVESEYRFMACLEACLNTSETSQGTRDNALREAQWSGWTFNSQRTFATKKSLNTYHDTFGGASVADLTLSPHHGKKGIRLRMGQLRFSMLSPTVDFIVDGKRFEVKGDRHSGSESFWTSDEALLRALRNGHRLEVKVTPFGEPQVAFSFDLSGIRDVTNIIWP